MKDKKGVVYYVFMQNSVVVADFLQNTAYYTK